MIEMTSEEIDAPVLTAQDFAQLTPDAFRDVWLKGNDRTDTYAMARANAVHGSFVLLTLLSGHSVPPETLAAYPEQGERAARIRASRETEELIVIDRRQKRDG